MTTCNSEGPVVGKGGRDREDDRFEEAGSLNVMLWEGIGLNVSIQTSLINLNI